MLRTSSIEQSLCKPETKCFHRHIHCRSGSGCVITFLAKLLQDENIGCHCIATDINKNANEVTQRLSTHNKVNAHTH